MKNIGFLGLGRMGQCLLKGLLESGTVQKKQAGFTTRHEETGADLQKRFEIVRYKDNLELVKKSEVILLAVKPQNAKSVLESITPVLTEKHILLSIVASLSTHQIETITGKKIPVIRAMPNTPALILKGITAICLGKYAIQSHQDLATQIFSSVGKVVVVDEQQMNAVTGLSGCGPAYAYVILESLTDGGIKVGLARELATQLAAQTLLGAAAMLLETGKHPAALKDEVTTPAGCTIDGLMELEEGKLRVTLIKAVVQATKRARMLAKK